MATYQATASADIDASVERVYSLVADYVNGHPRILPRPPFGSLVVEQGGVGTGTVVAFSLMVMGRERALRARIDEPEPGRVLTETDLATGVVTTFTFEALSADRSRVTIATVGPLGAGLLAGLERFLTVSFLEGTYRRELALLRDVARGQP